METNDDGAIFRVGVFRSLAFHSKILNTPCYFNRTLRNHVRFRYYMVFERLNLRKDSQVGSKNTILVENLQEIN